MRLELGKDVIASDGEKLGKVDRLVLNSDTNDLIKFVVHKGMFWSDDRIIDLELVSTIDSDGHVHLRVSSDEGEKMPAFVEETFRVASEDESRHLGYGAYMGTAPYAPIWYAPGGATGTYRPGSGPFFDGAETTSGSLETRSNLPANSMSVDTGTDVLGSDGDKVGEVEEVVLDTDGHLSGIIVKAGFIFTHDVNIPAASVDTVTSDHVQLNLTSDEAESRYASK
jgi:uncharacterized protein YrrD